MQDCACKAANLSQLQEKFLFLFPTARKLNRLLAKSGEGVQRRFARCKTHYSLHESDASFRSASAALQLCSHRLLA